MATSPVVFGTGYFDMGGFNYIQRIEYDSNSSAIYIGWAQAGTQDADAKWRIVQNTYDGSNRFISSAFPGGSPAFNYSWTLRASYTYS